jgi:hypothetical protein
MRVDYETREELFAGPRATLLMGLAVAVELVAVPARLIFHALLHKPDKHPGRQYQR